MVSRNGRKQNLRENGSHRHHRGSGVSARRGVGGASAPAYSSDTATRDTLGLRGEYTAGALDVLVDVGGTAIAGRPDHSPNPSALGNRLTKNLFIAGTPGVGKT